MLNATELMQTKEAIEIVLNEIDLEVVEEIVDDLVYISYDYQMYGDMGNTYMTINLKNRPKINNKTLQEFENKGLTADLNDYIETRLELFADELSKEDNSFAILGRSGGYWGYDVCNSRCVLTLSKKGTDLVENMLEEYVQELMDNGETDDTDIFYNKIEGDVTYTQVCYEEVLDRYKCEIAEELIKETDNFEIESWIIEKMNKLNARVIEEEKSINKGLIDLLNK